MRTSPMQKLAVACVAAFALVGSIGAANAEMHGGGEGFHGGGGLHDGSRFHGGGFHGGALHGHSHDRVFIGAPIIFGPGYYAYDYSYGDPGAADVEPQDSGTNYWYCRNPAGYYPDVQTCPGGWLQVIPNN